MGESTKNLSRSQAKMGRGLPLCEQLRGQTVQQFRNNFTICTLARNLGISSVTVHNIIKQFEESATDITTWALARANQPSSKVLTPVSVAQRIHLSVHFLTHWSLVGSGGACAYLI